MSIAGHVSRAMLSRYSHVRMEAKRRALDEIATRQRAADGEAPAGSCGGLSISGGSVIVRRENADRLLPEMGVKERTVSECPVIR